MVYGILPMAGKGSRIQPIAFSKELYPVAYKNQHFAISEFSIRAMQRAGVDEIKLVVHPDKQDIFKYYSRYKAHLSVYPFASKSLPESCLYPTENLHDEDVCLFGLPDTLFSPPTGFSQIKNKLLTGADICLGLFKVKDGSKYDSVEITPSGIIERVVVKQSPPLSNLIWGIWGANVKTLKLLKKEISRQKTKGGEKLLGNAFNSLTQYKNVKFVGVTLSNDYFDIGTMDAIVRIGSIIGRFEF